MNGLTISLMTSLQNVPSTFINNSSNAVSRQQIPAEKDGSQPKDTVTISQQGRSYSQDNESGVIPSGQATSFNESQLSDSDLTQLQQLKARDLEVRTHEQAHLSAAGQYAASGSSFTYQQGPDGKRYAIGGEVQIDIGKEDTPEATIQKMEVIARAALAPASPSSADRQIAAQAAVKASQARQEMIAEEHKARQSTDSDNASEVDSEGAGSAIKEQSNAPPASKRSSDVPPATLKSIIDSYKNIQALGG